MLGAEVEETLKRLQSQKGVQGIIVVNTEATPQDRSVCPFSFGKSEAKRDPLLSSAVTYTGQNKRLKCASNYTTCSHDFTWLKTASLTQLLLLPLCPLLPTDKFLCPKKTRLGQFLATQG
ncbi:dynein light chain roadblock-type 1 isoform X3 [Pteropus medius]|uniref:dynein light chain roadblock-type 1 isoform X3 n=1 Tax=Pteropus vampyrus TaxID=132908 RepID=UPI00196AE512|nr:dynein light chain roadblock-type 1 isoform X3 [Pteropus giganteus]